MKPVNKSINYIEFPMNDNAATKAFYGSVFGWEFQDWGLEYISFSGAGIDGGFDGAGKTGTHKTGVLVVLFADDLPQMMQNVRDAGGEILQDIYEFPGGKRFHFKDPNGNELAIWAT